MRKLLLLLTILLPAAGAQAQQDPFVYLRNHVSLVAGLVVVDGTQHKLVEVRVSDDFRLADGWRGAWRGSLFSVARAGEIQPPLVAPTSLEELKAYSDAELFVSIRREFNPYIAGECVGGLTLKTASLAGPNVDPLDGTKLIGACGIRLSKDGYNVSGLFGHYGPVVEAGKMAGFFPSLILRGTVPLGKDSAFVPDLAFGRKVDGTVTSSMRFAIATRF